MHPIEDAAVLVDVPHFFNLGCTTFPSLPMILCLPGSSPRSAKCLICSYVNFTIYCKGQHAHALRRLAGPSVRHDD